MSEDETWEYRNVGYHSVQLSNVGRARCLTCGAQLEWSMDDGYGFCPSRREKRRIGPWEPEPTAGQS